MLSSRLIAITEANAKGGEYSGTYFQMTQAGFDRVLELATPDSPMQSWVGGASISYLTGISVALLEDLPDNMWRLCDVNTDVVIEEGFIEDEPPLPQKPYERRTETTDVGSSD